MLQKPDSRELGLFSADKVVQPEDGRFSLKIDISTSVPVRQDVASVRSSFMGTLQPILESLVSAYNV